MLKKTAVTEIFGNKAVLETIRMQFFFYVLEQGTAKVYYIK